MSVLQRLLDRDKTVTLDDIRSCNDARGSRPQLRDVHNLVTPDYAAHWRAISTQLGLKVGLLDTIDHDHHHKAEDCCNAVWEQWLDMDTTASWSKVIEAVESSAVEFYTNERYKGSEDDWPSYQPEHFTSVALIHHREKHVTTREVIAIANVLHKGEVNVGCASNENQQGSSYLQYYDSKISTNIAEIFCKLTSHTSQGEQKVILIEGSPGIGKTILSKEIAFQWAKNKLLNEKMLLFLIFLRDPYLQNVQTLEHFVCYAISSTQRNSMVASVEQYLEETSGKHCVVVCDGYDEISEEVRCNSFISKLISRKVLKLSSLVITSRPTTSACLHGIADRRVEILGFTKEDRNRYIHQSLAGNTVEIRLIEEYFEVNPFIDSLCYIPLNMTILICLLKESLGTCSGLPKTQTEINKQFTFVTIARYLRRHHNHILTVKFLQNLPMPYKEQLDNLAKLAFVFLGKDKIVFNDDDVANDCPDCVGKWDSLGLLKIVKYSSLLADSTSFSYNFLHFSVQEYLAAFYIASLSDKKQAKILKNYFWNSKYLNMGIMYFGLTGGDSVALKHFLSGNKFFFFSKFFGANQIERRVSEDKVKCLHLFQCFLEADNDKLIQKVGKILEDDTIDLSNNALLHKDIHILSFFLVRSANKTWRSLDLSGCYIGDQGFDIFAKSFAECSKNRTTIKAVYLPYNYLTSSSINGIINLILCFKVEKITLSNNNNINYEDFDDKLLRSSIDDNRVIKMVAEKTEDAAG
ncbi:NACHT, LRR and PYD domains-containing protein 3-like [Dysidea avara]|uniref:NACHT, LRR and PYD domains-containing protein 3-like n=1 Tax=Dysidea avara TaxID=196820 RepID=UPI003332286A